MTKQLILGKTLLLFILSLSLFGNIEVSVDKPKFLQGDEVTLEIKADGDKIEFFSPKTISGFKITNSGISEQKILLNGKLTKQKVASYTFSPNRSIVIPSILVKIDGKQYNTNKIKIEKIKPETTKQNGDFELLLATTKQQVYVGEAIVASIVFKHKIGLEVLDAKLDTFTSDGFLIKELASSKPKEKNGYILYQNNYLLFPQKSGTHIIQNQLINVATREKKTNFMRWERVFSKEQIIKVLPLPNKISLQGDFKIKSFVDKKETTQNTPINLTIHIEGIGNINDILDFALVLPTEIVYSTKPQIKTTLKDGKFGGTFTQKISIIGENNFIIPSFKLKYFDTINNQIKTIQTEPINIKINGSAKQPSQVETKNEDILKDIFGNNDYFIRYLYGFIGFLFGLLVTYIFIKKGKWKKSDTPLIKQIKMAKNDKELYDILIPHSQNNKIKPFMRLLEDNIYKNTQQKINKKALIGIFDDDCTFDCVD